jgi:hypothetical protein
MTDSSGPIDDLRALRDLQHLIDDLRDLQNLTGDLKALRDKGAKGDKGDRGAPGRDAPRVISSEIVRDRIWGRITSVVDQLDDGSTRIRRVERNAMGNPTRVVLVDRD